MLNFLGHFQRHSSVRRHRGLGRAIILLVVLLGFVGVGTAAASPRLSPPRTPTFDDIPGIQGALSDVQWIYGQTTQTQTTNCTVLGNPRRETLAQSVAAYAGKPGSSPQVGDVYYAMAQWAIVGLPCGGGGAYVHLEVSLPPGTELAISSSAPVRCFYDNFASGSSQEEVASCPQSATNGVQGGLSFDPPLSANTNGLWPTPVGHDWRIMIPLVSHQPLSGIEASPCTTCFVAKIHQIDGVDSPWTAPQVGVAVVAPELPFYRLDVRSDNPGLIVKPAGGTFHAGAEVKIQAIDKDNYRFSEWTVNGSKRSDNPLTLVMDRDYTVIAHFVPVENGQQLAHIFLPLVIKGTSSPNAPGGGTSAARLVGTWTRQDQYSNGSYVFRSDGSFEYVGAYRFTDKQGCTVSRATHKTGTFAVANATLTLKTTAGSVRTSECGTITEKTLPPSVESLTWRVEADTSGVDELFLSDANGELSWRRER